MELGNRPFAACLIGKPGWHLVWVRTNVGELLQYQEFRVHVTDPQGEAARAAKTAARSSAGRPLGMPRPDAAFQRRRPLNFQAAISLAASEDVFRPLGR